MMPSAIAATPDRSIENVSLAPSRPPAGTSSVSPSSRSRPARTSVRNSSPVGDECIPILRNGFDCSRPGMPESRTNDRILRSAGGLPSSSLQMKTMVSAYGPFVMNVFEPLSTYSSPSRRAVDLIEPKASEPEFGSVIAHAPILSSVRRSSAHRSFCAVVPRLMIAALVRPIDTPIAVTMPGQWRHNSMIGIIDTAASLVRPAASACRRRRLRPAGRVPLAFDATLELLARHDVHAERGEQLAQDVVGRQITVLELVALGHDLRLDELADGIADHLMLFGPFEHGATVRAPNAMGRPVRARCRSRRSLLPTMPRVGRRPPRCEHDGSCAPTSGARASGRRRPARSRCRPRRRPSSPRTAAARRLACRSARRPCCANAITRPINALPLISGPTAWRCVAA